MAIGYGTFTITDIQDITITSTSVTYQKGTSGTIQPTGTWLDTIPSIGEGEYLWTKTVVTYSDSSETESYSVSRNAINGTNGNSPTVVSTITEYAQTEDGVNKPTSGWNTTPPSALPNKYMWTKVTVTYSDGAIAVSYNVAKNGIDGKDGGKWYSGTKITGTSTTATIFSDSGITSAVVGDMYLNTTTYDTYRCTTAGAASVAKWIYVNNIKGGVGDTGKGISSIQNLYCLSSSNVEAIGTWDSTPQAYVAGKYYWTKSHIVWTDNTETDTTAVLDNGLTDANANAIDARKVATNYLAVDNTGIMIADMEDGEQTPSGILSGKNVFIDNNSVEIRDGQNTLSSFGSNSVVLGQRGKSRLELSSTSICGIADDGTKNFNIINGDSQEERTITKNGTFESNSSDNDKFNGEFVISDEFYYFHNITISIVFNYIWDGQSYTTYPLTLNINDPVEDETPTVWGVFETESSKLYSLDKSINCSAQHNNNNTSLYCRCDAKIKPKTTGISYEMGNIATYSVVIETKIYQNASYTFGSRVTNSEHGTNSFAIGEGLVASSDNQIAIGKYNNNDSEKNYAFMIGNGIYGKPRSNAFTVDWLGVAEAANLKLTENMFYPNSEENFIKCTNINEDDVFTVTKTGDVTIANDLNIGGDININDLSIDGDISATGDINSVTNINATGNADIGGNLSVTGDVSITGDIDSVTNINTTGNSTIGGTSTITGKLTANGGVDVVGNIGVTGDVDVVNGDISTTGDLDVGGDTTITGNATITGNTGITGNLNVVGSITGNSLPLLKTQAFYWNSTINANSSFTSYGFDVTQSGYTALGVVTFGVYDQSTGGRNSSWCVVPKCILWGGDTQTLDLYVWNQHPSQSAVVTVIVKVLYALPSII